MAPFFRQTMEYIKMGISYFLSVIKNDPPAACRRTVHKKNAVHNMSRFWQVRLRQAGPQRHPPVGVQAETAALAGIRHGGKVDIIRPESRDLPPVPPRPMTSRSRSGSSSRKARMARSTVPHAAQRHEAERLPRALEHEKPRHASASSPRWPPAGAQRKPSHPGASRARAAQGPAGRAQYAPEQGFQFGSVSGKRTLWIRRRVGARLRRPTQDMFRIRRAGRRAFAHPVRAGAGRLIAGIGRAVVMERRESSAILVGGGQVQGPGHDFRPQSHVEIAFVRIAGQAEGTHGIEQAQKTDLQRAVQTAMALVPDDP